MSELIISDKGIRISEETPQGKCRFFHRWSKWTVFFDKKCGAYHVLRQRRECVRCGKVEIDEQML